MEVLKTILCTFQALLLAFVTQSIHALCLLIILFIGNIIFGLVADLFYNGNCFSFKKFLQACIEFSIYVCLLGGIVVISYFLEENELGKFAIKTMSWLFVYAYGTNILKNAKAILPRSIIVNFTYYIFSFEVIKKIPYFESFQQHLNKDT
jgi:hypothetical protein